MAEPNAEKKLFVVRVYPESGPLSLIMRLATSAREAEDFAKKRVGFTDAAIKVHECALDEEMLISIGEKPSH